MRDHIVKCVFPRPLAKRSVQRDIAAKQALDTRPDVAHNRTRTHNNATNHSERFDYSVPRQFKCGRRQRMRLSHIRVKGTEFMPREKPKVQSPQVRMARVAKPPPARNQGGSVWVSFLPSAPRPNGEAASLTRGYL